MPYCQRFNSARKRKREAVSQVLLWQGVIQCEWNSSGCARSLCKDFCVIWGPTSCFSLYEAFKLDADENVKCVLEKGKCKVAAIGLHGEFGPFHRIWKTCCRRWMMITRRIWYRILDTGSWKKIWENVKQPPLPTLPGGCRLGVSIDFRVLIKPN